MVALLFLFYLRARFLGKRIPQRYVAFGGGKMAENPQTFWAQKFLMMIFLIMVERLVLIFDFSMGSRRSGKKKSCKYDPFDFPNRGLRLGCQSKMNIIWQTITDLKLRGHLSWHWLIFYSWKAWHSLHFFHNSVHGVQTPGCLFILFAILNFLGVLQW